MKYMLLAKHVLSDQRVLGAGTVVGDDTPYPWRDANGEEMPPSTQMAGLDAAAGKAVRDLHQKLYGRAPPWEIGHSDEDRAAEEKAAKKQDEVEKNSEPVSDQQEAERKYGGANEKDPVPVRSIPRAAMASPPSGGDKAPSPGPATPKQPKADEVRPTKPNEEQYPKG